MEKENQIFYVYRYIFIFSSSIFLNYFTYLHSKCCPPLGPPSQSSSPPPLLICLWKGTPPLCSRHLPSLGHQVSSGLVATFQQRLDKAEFSVTYIYIYIYIYIPYNTVNSIILEYILIYYNYNRLRYKIC